MRLTVLLPYLKNRYMLVLLFTAVWLLVFDRYDVGTKLRMRRKISQLEVDKRYYEREIGKLRYQNRLMKDDMDEVERIAREQYFMKRPHEDVFILAKPMLAQ